MKVAVVGATGLLGTHLVAALGARGDGVVALSRRSTEVAGVATTRWEPAREPLPAAARDGVDAIVNLAGEPLAVGRWGDARTRTHPDSRVAATRGVAAALGDGGPRVLVAPPPSAIYGECETAGRRARARRDDFLADLCVAGSRRRRRRGIAPASCSPARASSSRVTAAPSPAPSRREARRARLDGVGAPVGPVDPRRRRDRGAAALPRPRRGRRAGEPRGAGPGPPVRAGPAIRRPCTAHRPCPRPRSCRAALGESASLVLSGQQVVPSVLFASGFLLRARLARRGAGRAPAELTPCRTSSPPVAQRSRMPLA